MRQARSSAGSTERSTAEKKIAVVTAVVLHDCKTEAVPHNLDRPGRVIKSGTKTLRASDFRFVPGVGGKGSSGGLVFSGGKSEVVGGVAVVSREGVGKVLKLSGS